MKLHQLIIETAEGGASDAGGVDVGGVRSDAGFAMSGPFHQRPFVNSGWYDTLPKPPVVKPKVKRKIKSFKAL